LPAGGAARRGRGPPPLARPARLLGLPRRPARPGRRQPQRRGCRDHAGVAARHDRRADDGDGARARQRHLSSRDMTIDDEPGRYATKRDRLARLTRLVAILQAHPEGMRTGDIATRVGMSVRTVYRDLIALQDELRLPVWGEDGVWGIDSEKAFLPPLKLTQ